MVDTINGALEVILDMDGLLMGPPVYSSVVDAVNTFHSLASLEADVPWR